MSIVPVHIMRLTRISILRQGHPNRLYSCIGNNKRNIKEQRIHWGFNISTQWGFITASDDPSQVDEFKADMTGTVEIITE